MPWVAILFGWPAALMSIVVGVLGVVRGRWRVVIAGFILAGPFLFYLSLTPRFGWVSMAAAFSYLAAVSATRHQRLELALLLLAPMLLLVGYAASGVLMPRR